MNRNAAIAAVVTLLSTSSAAAIGANAYIEGQLGYTWVDDVDTVTATDPAFGTASGTLNYDDNINYGLEIGIENFEKHNVLRLGLSWNRFEAKLDTGSVNITGGTQVGAISGTVSSSQLKSVGLDFDNTVNVYMANFYYDIPVEMSFKPYVGLGLGIADVEHATDNEAAYSASVGGRMAINENTKLGIKYTWMQIGGSTDEVGIPYEDFNVSSLTATLSYSF